MELVNKEYLDSGKTKPLTIDKLEELTAKVKNSSAELKQQLQDLKNTEKEYLKSVKT